MADDKYPFLEFIQEDKSHYRKASELGFVDPDDLFLVGESGGFLMNIQPGMRFVNTHLFKKSLIIFLLMVINIVIIKKIVFLIDSFVNVRNTDVKRVILLRV